MFRHAETVKMGHDGGEGWLLNRAHVCFVVDTSVLQQGQDSSSAQLRCHSRKSARKDFSS